MRRCLAFLLVAALAAAEDDAAVAQAVEALVRDLGAKGPDVRALARFRLAAYGEKIRPLLERVVSDDPEVRRSLRCLMRSGGKVQIELLPPATTALQIGAPLVLDVRIVNNSEQDILLLPPEERQKACPFRIRVGNRDLPPLGFDEVNWGDDERVTILAGATRKFRLTLEGMTSPLRRPALHEVSVVFQGNIGRGYGTTDEDSIEIGPLVLETAAVRIHVLGRKAEELEKALGGDDARQREAAAAELGLREDDAVVPILRRHARERLLRLAAIRRLGAIGAPEDFDLVFEATRDENADVRKAAVLGLGKYTGVKARAKLLVLASDAELQAEAIRALRGHKHPATIDRFVAILEKGGQKDSIPQIRAALLEWTGLTVDARPSEVRAFKVWWQANRAQWAEKNASGK